MLRTPVARLLLATLAAAALLVVGLAALPVGGPLGASVAGLTAGAGQAATQARALWAGGLPFLPRSPEGEVKAALARAHAAGSYRFTAASRQTLIPRARAATIGQGSQHAGVSFEGAVALPDRSRLDMTVLGGNLAGPKGSPVGQGKARSAALLRDGARSFALREGRLTPVDGAANLGSPTVDLLGFLAGARNITRAGEEDTAGGQVTRYRFDLDGPAFARHVRDETERAMRGELPQGLQLSPSPALAAMTGWGELWVDEAGYPRRQVIHFATPAVSQDFDGAGDLTVDFRDFGVTTQLPRIVPDGAGGWQQVSTGPDQGAGAWLAEVGGRLPLAAGYGLLLALAALAFAQRRRRAVYAAIVAVTCGSLVAGPLLQAWGTSQFMVRQAQAAEGPSVAELLGADRPTPAQAGTQSGDAAMPRAIPNGLAASPSAMHPGQTPPAGGLPQRVCTEANSPTADYDKDGLSDEYEGCLGTDPTEPDSDADFINDRLEISGTADAHGVVWTSDPSRTDSNQDGLPDGSEWPSPNGTAPKLDVDGNGLPNIWDPDNDGDGVDDGADVSPNVVSQYADTFDMSIIRPAADITDTQAYAIVEIQVQPQDSAHLRYGLTPLDWPPDSQGQIQNLGTVDKDVTLVPLLFVKSNISPTLSARYGVTVGPNQDSDSAQYPYLMYLPLQPTSDGGAVSAFFGALAYTPAEAQNVTWQAQMAWMVQGQLDQWKNCAADTTPSAANCSGYDTQTGTIQVYTEPALRVVGLNVQKSRPTQVATFGTPSTPNNDASLFQLMIGLGATFLVSNSVTLTDVVKTARDPQASTAERFNISVPVQTVWSGDDPDPGHYAYRDVAMATTSQTTTVKFLQQYYHEADEPSLVYAFEQSGGVTDLADVLGSQSPSVVTANVNLTNITNIVQRGLKLTMYAYEANYWAALGYSDAMTVAADRAPDLSPTDQFLQSYFYAAFMAGQISTIAVDGVNYATSVTNIEDLSAVINTGTWSTVGVWIDLYAQKAGVNDNVYTGDTLDETMVKITTYSETTVGAGLFVLGVVASLILVALDAYALATGNAIVADIVTAVNDTFIVVAGVMGVISIYGTIKGALKTVEEPIEIEMENMGDLPEDYQVGDDVEGFEGGDAMEDVADVAEGSSTFGMALGVITLIIQVAIVLITLVIMIANNWGNPVAIGLAVAQAIATLIVVIALFLILLIPEVGAAIVAVIFLLNLFIEFITWLFLGQSFNVLGWLIDTLASLFYHVDVLAELTDVQTGAPTSKVANESDGVVEGNYFTLSAALTSTIGTTNSGKASDVENSYAWGRWDGSQTTDATFTGPTFYVAGWCDYSNTDSSDSAPCYNPVSAEWQLRAKRNAALEITTYLEYTLAIKDVVLEIIQWHSTTSGITPDSTNSTDVDNATTPIYLDVLPNTVDGLWGWTSQIHNNDMDADGLTNSDESGTIHSNPNLWDSDADGLSDGYEVQGQTTANVPSPGTNPLAKDSDGDGLTDGEELTTYNTTPTLADTDGDGLTDSQEVCRYVQSGASWVRAGGWLAEIPNGDTVANVPVCSNPNDPDEDDDLLNDAQERSAHTSPLAPNTGLPFLTLETTPFALGPNGQAGTYVAPGAAVGVDLTLVNQGRQPATSPLALCLPGNLKNVRQTAGQTGTSSAGACGDPSGTTLTWPYSAGNPLPVGGELQVELSAQADPGATASSTGLVQASMPYSNTVITGTARVVVDDDDPLASVLAPPDGAALRGESYVVGGTATDASSWVTQVAVNLGQPSGWTEVITKSTLLNPWSATWTLPATDGTYAISAQATDYVGHRSGVAKSTVVVDNTPPTVTINLVDGGVLTGGQAGANGVVTYTLTGTAADNLSGLTQVDLSLDGRPWVPAAMSPASGAPTAATWSYAWVLPGSAAQGSHRVVARAVDRAGNESANVGRTAVVDTLPPGMNLSFPPPGLPVGQPFTLHGHADETTYLPPEVVPAPLTGSLDAVLDASVWLGAPGGSTTGALSWLGDMNGDGRSDLAVGLPNSGAGAVAVLYGQAGGWRVPLAQQSLADSPSSFVGAANAQLGSVVAGAGDVDGDGFDDLLIGDPKNSRAFLVYGSPAPLGNNLALTGVGRSRTLFTGPAGATLGQWLAPAGDVNSDGRSDLLLGSTVPSAQAYLFLGASRRPYQVRLQQDAAARLPFPPNGAPVLGVGDVNDDRYGDFVLADPTNSFGSSGVNRPALYLFQGGDTWAAPAPGEGPATPALGSATALSSGGNAVGQQVTALGDIDGNGADDFAYTAGNGPQLALGQPGAAVTVQALGGFSAAATLALAGVGDVSADGLADLVVVTSGNQAQLIHGAKPFPASPTPAATLANTVGVASAPPVTPSDCNCDGSADLLLLPAPGAVASVRTSTLAGEWTTPPVRYELLPVAGGNTADAAPLPAPGAVAGMPPAVDPLGWLAGKLGLQARVQQSPPTTVYVSPSYCPGCANDGHTWGVDAFVSIQSALDAGAPKVVLAPGVYRETVTLPAGVQLLGSGADVSILEPPAGGLGSTPLVAASGSSGNATVLSGLTLAGSGQGTGLRVSGGLANMTLKRAIVRNLGIGVALDGAGTQVQLVNNTLVNNGQGFVSTTCAAVNVRNTIFALHTGAAMTYATAGCGTQPLNRYNLFWRNGSDGATNVVVGGSVVDASTVGQGMVLADPLFQNVTRADFHLQSGSPAIAAGSPDDEVPPLGSDRVDIGYAQHLQAATYADANFCAACANGGLDWGVNAFTTIADAVNAAKGRLTAYGCGGPAAGCAGGLTVGVGPGNYPEIITLPSNLQLLGSGGDLTTVGPAGGGNIVTIADATHVQVAGLKLATFGANNADVAINITGASNYITVTRNLLVSAKENSGTAIGFAGNSRGAAFYNTVTNAFNGLSVSPTGRVSAVNNIFADNNYAMNITSTGGVPPQVLSQSNLFYQNVRNYPAGNPNGNGNATGSYTAQDDLVNVDPLFVNAAGGNFHLSAGSPALGAANLSVPVAAGGGDPDLGYNGLLAIPATLLFGEEGASCAVGNSGVAQVQVGLGLVSDPTQPISATLPTSWTTASLSVTGQTGTYWSAPVTAATAGTYRLYGRTLDRAGNSRARFIGSYLADSATPTVRWLSPIFGPPQVSAALRLTAEADDPVSVFGQTVYNLAAAWFVVDGQQVPAQWLAAASRTGTSTRRFSASVPVGAGSHSVEAFALDGGGNVGSSGPGEVPVSGSDVATITVPPYGMALKSAQVRVQGFARLTTANTPVTLYVDGTSAGTATLASSTQTLTAFGGQVTLTGEVTHTLQAVVAGGSVANAPAVQVRLDLTAPTLSVNAPANNVQSLGPVTFSGTAADSGSGLVAVQLSVDGGITWAEASLTPGAGSTAWTYTWRPKPGTDYVTFPAQVRALDRAGNTTIVNRAVLIDNTPPESIAATFCYTYGTATCSPVLPGVSLTAPGALKISWTPPVLDGSGPAWTGIVVNQTGSQPPATSAFKAASPPYTQNFTPPPLTATGNWYVHLGSHDTLNNWSINSFGPFVYPTTAQAATTTTPSQEPSLSTPIHSSVPVRVSSSVPVRVPPAGLAQTVSPTGLSPTAETTAPTVTIRSASAYAARTGPHTLIGDSSDGNGSGVVRVEVRQDGGAWQVAKGTHQWSAVVTAPASGSFRVEARAVDADGNLSPVAGDTVLVDNTPPTATLKAPAEVSGDTVVVEVLARDPYPVDGPIAHVEVQVDGGTWRAADRVGQVDGGQHLWRFAWRFGSDITTLHFRARATDIAGNKGGASPEVTVRVVPDATSADLAVTQAAPATTAAGAKIAYTLRVNNLGPASATNVSLVDSLPGGVTLLAADPACALQGGTLVCALGTLAPGAERMVQFTVQFTNPGYLTKLTNVATVSATPPDPNRANNRSEAVTKVGPSVWLPWVGVGR